MLQYNLKTINTSLGISNLINNRKEKSNRLSRIIGQNMILWFYFIVKILNRELIFVIKQKISIRFEIIYIPKTRSRI